MTKRVSAANAKAHLSALVAEVAFGGEQVIIERRGKPLAVLVGLNDQMPEAHRERDSHKDARGALALVGAWRGLEDSDAADILADIDAQRDGANRLSGIS